MNSMSSDGFFARALTAGILSVGAACACSAQDPASPAQDRSTSPWATLDHELVLGSQGPEVRALHEYLTAYGYFPNPFLTRLYPAWRPIIADAPRQPDVFDQQTQRALLRLQANSGLPRSGVVDAATRGLLAEPRCGVPEGIQPPDPSDKFFTYGAKWNHAPVTWRVQASPIPAPLVLADVEAAASGAFAAWNAEISDFIGLGLTFKKLTTGTADITIKFDTDTGVFKPFLDAGLVPTGLTAPTSVAQPTLDTSPVPPTVDITSESIYLRDVANFYGVGTSNVHLQSVLTHEIGHALGLGHSNLLKSPPTIIDSGRPTMFAGIPAHDTAQSTPQLDDHVAIMSKYGVFVAVNNACCFKDVAGGKEGSIWGLSSTAFGDGFRVVQFVRGTQHHTDGSWVNSDQGAVAIAVARAGNPWVVTASGLVYYHTTNDATTGTWNNYQGYASDLGIGYNGDLWIVGLNTHIAWKLANGTWVPDHNSRSAVRITVGPDGDPYIVDSAQHAWHYCTSAMGDCIPSNDPNAGVWRGLAGQWLDLAVGPDKTSGVTTAYLWGIGGPLPGNLISLSVRADQGSDNGGQASNIWTPAFRLSTWGSGVRVGVDSGGNPWFVAGNGQIFTTIAE